MREYIRYTSLVLRTAFAHSLDLTQTILFIAFIVFGLGAWVARRVAPGVVGMIPDVSVWQAAAAVLGAVVLLRLLAAPYWVYQAQRKEIENLGGVSRRNEQEALEELAALYAEVTELAQCKLAHESDIAAWLDKTEDWFARTQILLSNKFSKPELISVTSGPIQALSFSLALNQDHNRHLQKLHAISSRLLAVIQRRQEVLLRRIS
jgi:hypothetical protein